MIRLLALFACAVPCRAQMLAAPLSAPVAFPVAVPALSALWDGSRAGLSLPTLVSVLPWSAVSVVPQAPRPVLRVLGQELAAFRPSRPLPEVASGDLVFLDLDCGALCDAMAEVTEEQFGTSGPRLNHVGIIEVEAGQPFVWEAWPGRDVARVPLREFLSRVSGGEAQPSGFYVGRLADGARALAAPALARVKAAAGAPYEPSFDWAGPGMYCSKLIAYAFGDGLFPTRPMYFGREGSRAREVWRAYFAARGMAIPDGQPGVSPLGLYLDGQRTIFRQQP